MSSFTASPGAVDFPGHIFLPGYMEVFMPVCTPSPTMVPSFLLPVSRSFPFTIDMTFLLSCLRLAALVPAPKFTFSPMTESPTYDRWGILEPLPIIEFFISTAWPTWQLSPIVTGPLM